MAPLTILFSAHDFRFLQPVVDYCRTDARFRVLVEEHEGHVIRDPSRAARLLPVADVVFCEWCLGNAVWYSQRKQPHQTLIVRLHSQELRLPYLQQVTWSNVDALVSISPEHHDEMLERFPHLRGKSRLIYNPVDCDALAEAKLFGAPFNLGLLGMLSKIKAPQLAIDILRRLREKDRRYTLSIKSKQPWDLEWLWKKTEERSYYEQLFDDLRRSEEPNAVVFERYDGRVTDWFTTIGFILSTSEREGSHQAVAEGMASGAVPIIRNWRGADRLYPAGLVFETVDEAVDLIRQLNVPGRYEEQSDAVKIYARERFDQHIVIGQLIDLMLQRHSAPAVSAHPIRESASRVEETSTARTGSANRSRPVVAMHVCFLKPGQLSGYRSRVVHQAHHLARAGVTVVIACFVPDAVGPRERQTLKSELQLATNAVVEVFETRHFFDVDSPPGGVREITSALESLAVKHRVDIVHGQALYAAMHALRAKPDLALPVVMDMHGFMSEETRMGGGREKQITAHEAWEREALLGVDACVYVSHRMAEIMTQRYGPTVGQMCVVPCCVDTDQSFVSAEIREARRTEHGFGGKFVLLYVGTLSVWQWPDAMFALAAQFCRVRNDVLFQLVLPASDHPRAREFVERSGIDVDRLRMMELPHHDVAAFAPLADAGLLLRQPHPVNAVSSPTKFGEYIGAGVPVIATPGIGDTSDLVERYKVGILVSATAVGVPNDDLARLTRFADDVLAGREAWSRRCREAAAAELEWSARIGELVSIYRQLAIGESAHTLTARRDGARSTDGARSRADEPRARSERTSAAESR